VSDVECATDETRLTARGGAILRKLTCSSAYASFMLCVRGVVGGRGGGRRGGKGPGKGEAGALATHGGEEGKGGDDEEHDDGCELDKEVTAEDVYEQRSEGHVSTPAAVLSTSILPCSRPSSACTAPFLHRLPGAMVARLASIAQRHQKVAGSSPAVVIFVPAATPAT
jgi:hypothetical protein